MYDVHLEKFRADVETVIKEEIARRKGQTLQDKEKRDIKARAQSTLKKATQSLKFARGQAPVWGTPSASHASTFRAQYHSCHTSPHVAMIGIHALTTRYRRA